MAKSYICSKKVALFLPPPSSTAWTSSVMKMCDAAGVFLVPWVKVLLQKVSLWPSSLLPVSLSHGRCWVSGNISASQASTDPEAAPRRAAWNPGDQRLSLGDLQLWGNVLAFPSSAVVTELPWARSCARMSAGLHIAHPQKYLGRENTHCS